MNKTSTHLNNVVFFQYSHTDLGMLLKLLSLTLGMTFAHRLFYLPWLILIKATRTTITATTTIRTHFCCAPVYFRFCTWGTPFFLTIVVQQ